MFWLTLGIFVVLVGGLILFRHWRMNIVPEDHAAVTVDKNGFIKRVLPAGRHVLYPFENIEFKVVVKPQLTRGQTIAVVTCDGISIDLDWSGVYQLQPNLITDKLSQRLRGLPNAEKAIIRSVDITLRKLVGDYPLHDLFKPAIRGDIERRLSQTVADKLKALGIALNGLNLQVIKLPPEVAEALNKAKAIETLDGAIRHLDPTTRDVVRSAYQLDEILHWDAYLPVPSRLGMKRLAAMAD